MDVLALQTKLKAAGFDPGPLDGIAGPRTAAALDAALMKARGECDPVAGSFEVAIDRVLSHEGGFSDDRRDPGNWTGGKVGVGRLVGTKYGIAANTYPNLDIRNLTREGAKAIYRRDYWDAVRGDELPACVAFQAFDVAVNHGVSRAVRLLQEAVGVPVDGRLGPVTMAAVLTVDGATLALRYNAARLRFYTGLKTWPTFGKGWARRVAANLDYAAVDRA